MATGDRAPCYKCNEEISTTADRCPECGFEPGSSTLGTILVVLLGTPLALIGLYMIATVPLAALGGGLGWYSAMMTLLIGAMVAGAGGALYYLLYTAGDRSPVDEPPRDPD